ncbi:unnamed protein product [Parnassius mnemosyne]|uniref:Uncharacterized protein n=1 Tax=Parnassius mnemosyne TaxID=213953 RepID=A0AAV1M3Q3_9NEOP
MSRWSLLPSTVSAMLSAVRATSSTWQDLRNSIQRLRSSVAVVVVCGVARYNVRSLMKRKTSDETEKSEGSAQKTENENNLKRIKSRELRGGIMYYSCHCIKRNGLQHDCRRTGCGGEPPCLVLPDPLCAPSQLARAHGLADPAPLAKHTGNISGMSEDATAKSGKRFIVCELKSVAPQPPQDDSTKKCCCAPKDTRSTDRTAGTNDPTTGLPILVMKLC